MISVPESFGAWPAVVYGIADPWTPGSGLYDWKDFDYVYNAYETVAPGPCSGVGCCSNSSLTTLTQSPSPYSCYLPYYSHAPEFNVTVRPVFLHPIQRQVSDIRLRGRLDG